jgi:hypothetical protein
MDLTQRHLVDQMVELKARKARAQLMLAKIREAGCNARVSLDGRITTETKLPFPIPSELVPTLAWGHLQRLESGELDAKGKRVATKYLRKYHLVAPRKTHGLFSLASRSDPDTAKLLRRLYHRQWVASKRARLADCSQDLEKERLTHVTNRMSNTV